MVDALPANQTYYYELGEGRWRGRFDFSILDTKKFLAADLPLRDRALALILHAAQQLPGQAVMIGEIACDPKEGHAGVARVDVSVERFGMEIYRLRGHYALVDDGVGVDIEIYQRFGPYGSPLENTKRATAEILEKGYLGVYYMKILGDDWVGRYDIAKSADSLDAEYTCPWGVTREYMERQVCVKPDDRRDRLRWDKLLDVARELEALDRKLEVAGDERALFTYAYGVVTRSIAFSITDDDFDDPDWVVALARAFARRYIKAVHEYDAGIAPRAWQRIFDAITKRETNGVGALVLSMAAHILHDLPLALLEVGMEDEHGVSRTADYHKINHVLSGCIDILQDRLSARYNPIFGWLDRLGTDADEILARLGLEQSRALAWYTAQRLENEVRRPAVMASVERDVDDVARRILGSDRPRRLLFRGVSSAVRLLRRAPKFPTPNADRFRAKNHAPRATARRDDDEDLLYGLHTAVAQARDPSLGPALRTAVSDAIRGAPLADAGTRLGDRLASPRSWDRAKARARENDRFKWRLAGLLARLGDADGATVKASDLNVGDDQIDAIGRLQSALGDVLKDGFDTAHGALQTAVGLLDATGVPASEFLSGFDDVRAHYDPRTELFEVEMPALVRRPFDEVKDLILPPNWTKLIPHMLDSSWIDGPDADGKGVIREVVNVWHPWVDDHPLIIDNELWVDIDTTTTKQLVKYGLHRSIDGALTVDDGYLSITALDPNTSVLVIKKSLKVVPSRNPLLYAMLRTNPDGLAYLLTYWVSSATHVFGEPDDGGAE